MLNRLVRLLKQPTARMLEGGGQRSLYQLADGNQYWLDSSRYLDRCLIKNGVFEPTSVKWVDRLVQTGDVVLDIGANIGYYSVIMARKVGAEGKVFAFEPAAYYRDVLEKNLIANNLASRVSIMDFGLSESECESEIAIGDCSATLHWVEDFQPRGFEKVKLSRLDSVFPSLGQQRLDFIKIDVDGHEPAFLSGAWETLMRYQPIILLEVNHANYLAAGYTAWQFYDDLIAHNFVPLSEKSGKPYASQLNFLRECGNFDRSANILVAAGQRALHRIEMAS